MSHKCLKNKYTEEREVEVVVVVVVVVVEEEEEEEEGVVRDITFVSCGTEIYISEYSQAVPTTV
jgi:hypothetical protein